MKQILQSYRAGELWLAECPAPICQDKMLLVENERSLISAGTEKLSINFAQQSLIGKAKGRPDLVRKVIQRMKTEGVLSTLEKTFAALDKVGPLGYSSTGRVLEIGKYVSEFRVGDRVACGGAGYASHAEVVCVPKNLCVPVPDNVSPEAASFVTLGAIALQGVRQADLRLGENAAVIGLGLIGLLTVQLLVASGCYVVGTDIDGNKCELAKEFGAFGTTPSDFPEACDAISFGHGVDAVIITASSPSNEPIETAARVARMKGRVVALGLVGMNVPRDAYYKKELELRLSMSYGPGRYDTEYEERGHDYPYAYVRWTENRNMRTFLALCADGKITPERLITHRFPFERVLDAYQLLEGKSKEPYLGIVLEYDKAGTTAETQRDLGEHREKESDRKTREKVKASELPEDEIIRVGIIGAGNFAISLLLPAMMKTEGAELVYVCSASGKNAIQAAKKFAILHAVSSPDDIFGDDSIHAVLIATPHNTHADYVIEALKAGKHVYTEKPLCLTEDELVEIASAYRQASNTKHCPILMVGFNRRFSPPALAIADFFKNRLSPIVMNYRVNAGFVPKSHWIQDPEVGGGRIRGEVCHFIDLLTFLAKSLPVSVHAASVRDASESTTDEDSTNITLTFGDGSIGTISYVAGGDPTVSKEYLEVIGGGKVALIDNFRRVTLTANGRTQNVRYRKQVKGFVEELQSFIQGCRNGTLPIAWKELVCVTKATFATIDSLRVRQVVSIAREG